MRKIWIKRNNEKKVEAMWEELKQIVFNNVVKKKVKKKKRSIGYKDQWDINYSRKKREVKRKNGKETEKKYLEKRKEFRELLEKKQKEKREKEEQEKVEEGRHMKVH